VCGTATFNCVPACLTLDEERLLRLAGQIPRSKGAITVKCSGIRAAPEALQYSQILLAVHLGPTRHKTGDRPTGLYARSLQIGSYTGLLEAVTNPLPIYAKGG